MEKTLCSIRQALFLLIAFSSLGWQMEGLATNGINVIGVSASSIGMGGTGVGHFTSQADAILKNPSLMGDSGFLADQFDVEVQTSYVKPSMTGDYGTGAKNNQGIARFIPDVAVAYRWTKDFTLGLGFLGYAGASSDYTGETGIKEPKTYKSVFRISPAASYRVHPKISVGIAPLFTYGEFSINHSLGAPNTQTTRGLSTAYGIGGQIGISATPFDFMRVGISYTTQSNLNYKDLIDLELFGASPAPNGLDALNIQTPAEVAVGVSAEVVKDLLVAVDYRNIGWGGADGFKHFGWGNQNVIALGAKYQMAPFTFRAGFNYADSPISNSSAEDGTATVDVQGHSVTAQNVSVLNVFAFPAISTTHWTLGAGYEITPAWTIDAAFMVVPEAALTRASTAAPYTFRTTHSQWAASLGIRYRI